MARNDDLERAARQATPNQLHAMLHSNYPDVAQAARDENRRRAEERRTMNSLTGNVRPVDET